MPPAINIVAKRKKFRAQMFGSAKASEHIYGQKQSQNVRNDGTIFLDVASSNQGISAANREAHPLASLNNMQNNYLSASRTRRVSIGGRRFTLDLSGRN